MPPIKVNVSVYGSIAHKLGGSHVAQRDVELPPDSTKDDLLAYLGITHPERSYIFINAVLCDLPGLITDGSETLQDRDHVGIFAVDYMWPYQYRDGVRMSEYLKKALQIRGAMHHSYDQKSDGQNLDSSNARR